MHKWLSSGSLRIEHDSHNAGQDEPLSPTQGDVVTIAPRHRDTSDVVRTGEALPSEETRVPPHGEQEAEDPLLREGSSTVSPAKEDPRSNKVLAEKYRAARDISSIEIEHNESRCCNAKYGPALRNLLPWRPAPKDPTYLPSQDVGLLSCMSLSWMSRLMYKTRRGLQQEDMWRVQEADSSQLNTARLTRLWQEEQQRAQRKGRAPQLNNAVVRFIATRTLVAVFVSLLNSVVMFLQTSHVIRMTLDYVNSPVEDMWQAWLVLVLVVVLNLFRALSFNAMFVVSTHCAMRATGALQGMVFQKVLRLQTGGEELSAQVANIINNDMERIMEAVISIVFLPGLPVITLAALVYSWYIVGAWCLLGYLAIFVFVPILKHVTVKIGQLRLQVSKVSDSRVSLMSEVLNNIRLIKMYSWEDSFAAGIEKLRSQEVHKVRGIGLLQSLNMTINPVMSSVALLAIMVAITVYGTPITAATAFTLASVLNCFQFSLGTVPFMLRSVAEARVALGRIEAILNRREHRSHGFSVMQNNLALNLQHASFEWTPLDGSNPESASDGKSKQNQGKKGKQGTKTEDDHNGQKEGGKRNGCPGKQSKPKKVKNGKKNKINETLNSGQSPKNGRETILTTEKDTKECVVDMEMKELLSNGPEAETQDKAQPQLRGISLSLPIGKLLGICGSVGSGKTSLLSAICGDMALVSGEVQVNGRVALVPQQAWIYNTSLRANLLMGCQYDAAKYNQMIDACALKSDLQILADGDNSEIGEKGINLSGGQKQRVSLGRAVYSDREIYLLDDPLSAVDTRVAKHIFQRCIRGLLRGKTVLLVTHALHFLEQCDEVVLMKDGAVAERGTHAELLARGGAYKDFLSFDKTQRQDDGRRESKASSKGEDAKESPTLSSSSEDLATKKDGDGKLIEVEGRETGNVSSMVYRHYIKASGGALAGVAVTVGIVVYTAVRLGAVLWQQWWLDAGDGLMQERLANLTMSNTSTTVLSDADLRGNISEHPQLFMFQGVHFALFVAVIVTGLLKGTINIYSLTEGSRRLHNAMFSSILRAPTSFFDVTPTSRIVTRFSKDVDEMDYRMPMFFDLLMQSVFFMVASSLLVCFFFPYFTIVLVVVGAMFFGLGRMLDRGVKEFKRLESTQKSPVVQNAASCISGLQVIRAYGQEEMFSNKFYNAVDDHTVVMLVFRLSNRWFTFRMDLLATIIISAITALCVFTKGAFSTAVAGLALTSVNGMCQFLPFVMRIKSEFESRMTSVERVVEYAYSVPAEAPRHIEGVLPEGVQWPSSGAVTMRDVCLSYRPNLPLVLKNISVSVRGGEKIGVVGRTGAGKSSLIVALLRVVELDSGSIEIDGVDIRRLGLHTLRSAVSIIPQDPVLFQGTIKHNLDPFNDHSEEKIVEAARRSQLMKVVERHSQGLEAPVEAGGANFSVGERQLICLTRAVLRDSKVLLLDEATASVDPETDQLIQAALQTAFSDATLFTVAHRLNTVAHYDKIMVMEAGQLREFDTPEQLVQTEGSIFRQMLAPIGVTTVEQLRSLS